MLGSFPLGMNPLGGSDAEDIEELSPFMVFFALPNEYYPFNIQREFNTSGVGQQVVVLKEAVLYDYTDDEVPRSDLIK